MYLHGGLLGLAVATLPLRAVSELVTVTQYPSTCSAVYTTRSIFTSGSAIFTSGSSSVTIYEPTVTVSPIPSPGPSGLTDEALNNGATFVIQVQPGVSSRKRQALSSTYLTAGGWTSADPSLAVRYRISDGQLGSPSGGWVSTNASTDTMPFALSNTTQPISRQFVFEDLQLHWNNTAFEGGSAQFCTVPAGNGSQQVIVRFRGALDPRCAPVTLAAQPTTGLGIETISPIGSSAVSTAMSIGSMTMPSQGGTTTARIPTSTSANVSPQGTCGPGSGFNCYGAPDGNCCSPYGYCGSSPEHCGAGCQPGYGFCDSVGVSSSAAPSGASTGSGSVSFSFRPTSATSGMSMSSSVPILSSPSTYNSAASSSISFSVPDVLPTISRSISDGVTYSWTVTPQPSLSVSGSVTYTQLPSYTSGGEPIGPINPTASSSSMSMSMSGSSSGSMSMSMSGSMTVSMSMPTSMSMSGSMSGSSTSTSMSMPTMMSGTTVVVIATSTSGSDSSGTTYIVVPTATGSSSSSSASATSSSFLGVSSSSASTSATRTGYLQLASPTPCDFGDPPTWNEDDSYCRVDTQQPITLYSSSNTSMFASSNGVLAMGRGSSQYAVQRFPTVWVPPTTVAPMWDDLFVYREGDYSPEQGIWYQETAESVAWEWSVARAGRSEILYHWTLTYLYAEPGVVEIRYFETGGSEQGGFASIGMQGVNESGEPVSTQFAFKEAGSIGPGTVLRCDTNQNTCTKTA